MPLSAEQVTSILTEALNRGMYEVPDGAIPANEDQRNKDAKEIVSLCEAARENGNKSDNVNSILFISQNGNSEPSNPERNGNTTQPESDTSGLDLTALSDGILEQLIQGLDKYPPTEEVENDRKKYLAEKARRNGESSQEIQEVPQAEAQAAPAESAGENSADTAEPQGTDAGAFARAQTPETSKEEKASTKAPAEDGNRLKLESELTLPIVKAHGIDITKLSSLSVEELEFVLANPEGPPKEGQVPVSESEVESSAIPTNGKGGASVGGINANVTAPEVVVSKADLGFEIAAEDTERNVSDDREKLEVMVTGPMLKAWKRGRKEVPGIGDNELRLMIMNPDGINTVDAAVVEKAKLMDGSVNEEVAEQPTQEQTKISIPEETSQEDRTIVEAAQEAVAKQVPTNIITPNDIATIPQAQPGTENGQEKALAIIAKENFPIPPDIAGEPPRLPNDVSKVSRDELFSLHAGFHACESRVNWVISGYEDELGDLEKLRGNREITVAASVPLVIDEKRVTNEYRDAQVAADTEVLTYAAKEHELNKVVKKLKVLQRNYMKDCERLSRQMSKYEIERGGGPA